MKHRTAAVLACAPRVQHHARTLVGEAAPFVDRRDMEQDGWVAILQATTRYNGSVKFSTFVDQRLRGAMIDGLRRKEPRRRSTGEPYAAFVPLDDAQATRWTAPGPLPDTQCLATELWALVDQLPPRAAEVLRRLFRDGEDYWTVSAALGITPSRVSQIRRRALQTLRSLLNPAEAPILRR